MNFPKWVCWKDWTGFSIGWIPTNESPVGFNLFYQRGYYINLDVMITEKFDHSISYKICKPDNYLFPERRGFHFE